MVWLMSRMIAFVAPSPRTGPNLKHLHVRVAVNQLRHGPRQKVCGFSQPHGLGVVAVQKVILEHVLQDLRLPSDRCRQVFTHCLVETDLDAVRILVDDTGYVFPSIIESGWVGKALLPVARPSEDMIGEVKQGLMMPLQVHPRAVMYGYLLL